MGSKQRIKVGEKNVIGANIRRLRLKKRIHQTELAKTVINEGIPFSRECLVKIEGGRQHISLEQLNSIRDILECSCDDLLNEKWLQ